MTMGVPQDSARQPDERAQARAQVGEVKTTQFPFSANPRARILGETGHPTLPEAVLEAALGFRDATIHVHSR
jgi:hypothetical protein